MRTVILACAVAVLVTVCPGQHRVDAQAQDMGVAYVVQTITLRGATVRTEAGHRPQRVSPAADVTAITRIEVPAGAAVALSDGQVEQLAFAIADTADLPGVADVQVDFDATLAQRCFYRALIHRVSELLPDDTRLSITALAAWCLGDDWVSDLPIDEAVPMVGMRREWTAAAGRTRDDRRPDAGPCRNALGVVAK